MKDAAMTPRAYIEKLRAEAAEQNRIQALKRESEAAAKLAKSIQQIKRTRPLDDQINELMQTVPPALRARPWSTVELVPRLQGKYRDHPMRKKLAKHCAAWGGRGLDCGAKLGRGDGFGFGQSNLADNNYLTLKDDLACDGPSNLCSC